MMFIYTKKSNIQHFKTLNFVFFRTGCRFNQLDSIIDCKQNNEAVIAVSDLNILWPKDIEKQLDTLLM